MNPRVLRRVSVILSVVAVVCLAVTVHAAGSDRHKRGVELRMSGGDQIVSVSTPPQTEQGEVLMMGSAPAPFPVPPLGGFAPLIAITTSDERAPMPWELEWEHDLQSTYVGSPLNPPVEDNFVIGVFDSGAMVQLVAGDSATTLGLTGGNLTSNTYPIGGAGGGTVDAYLSQPVGIFAGSLSAIDGSGRLDPNQMIGHTNVSVLVAPEISCGSGDAITAVMGTPLVSFFTTVIRNDTTVSVTVGGKTFRGPDVQILSHGAPQIPTYPRSISMSFGGLAPVTTSSYYGAADLITPEMPTLLSFAEGMIPFGGAFFATIGALEGEPGPTNPIQNMRVLIDTGAQASIMTPAMAANLSMPVQPDFTVEVCSIGGLVTDVPGYYVDYIKINALGGAMEFSNAPFVVLDLSSPDSGTLDGVLGMNFFWDRNIIFEPSLSGSGFLHVSDPILRFHGDFDNDSDVDISDLAILAEAWGSVSGDGNWNAACDIAPISALDGKIDFADFILLAQHWTEGTP